MEKLGLSEQNADIKISSSVLENYKRVVCRYIGGHSLVPCKTASESISHGHSSLGLATRSTDSIFHSQVEATQPHDMDDQEMDNIKRLIARDTLMNKVKEATENNSYRKKFQQEHPNIPLHDIALEKANSQHFLTNKSTGGHPIYGQIVTKIILFVDNF